MRRTGRRHGPAVPPEEGRPQQFHWIFDGHNAIFAVPEWEDLQVAGQRREARRALEESLEAFGRAIGRQVCVVYDGNHMERNPDAVSWTHLHTEYSQPPEEADDRIRFLVSRALQEGRRPLVVTSDRRTLAGTLPPGVRTVEPGHFFGRIRPRLLRKPEKWVPEDLEDIERHFLGIAGEADGPAAPPGTDSVSGGGSRDPSA
jgi:hypothetical protein